MTLPILMSVPHAGLRVPPEAEPYCRLSTSDLLADSDEGAAEIYDLGPEYVLVKGGHLQGEAVDLLFDGHEIHEFRSARLETKNVHGTGCTYASAIATYLAQELDVVEAVVAAKDLITGAIQHGLNLGQGHGPTNPYAVVRQDW